MQFLIQGLESVRTELKSELELVGNTITTWRNPILAGLSFAGPLILAMTSLAPPIGLPQDFLLKLLIVDIVIGVGAFIVFTLIKGKVNGYILSVDTAFKIAKRKINGCSYSV